MSNQANKSFNTIQNLIQIDIEKWHNLQNQLTVNEFEKLLLNPNVRKNILYSPKVLEKLMLNKYLTLDFLFNYQVGHGNDINYQHLTF